MQNASSNIPKYTKSPHIRECKMQKILQLTTVAQYDLNIQPNYSSSIHYFFFLFLFLISLSTIQIGSDFGSWWMSKRMAVWVVMGWDWKWFLVLICVGVGLRWSSWLRWGCQRRLAGSRGFVKSAGKMGWILVGFTVGL